MKRVFFTTMIFLFAMANFAVAQVTSDTVSFDNYVSSTNNDLTQKCTQNSYLGTIFTQSATGGITGGTVALPDSVWWGNNVVNYNYTYKNGLGKNIKASICFKYDPTLYNSKKHERPVAIFLTPYQNGNYDFTATLTPYGTSYSLEYFTASNSVYTDVQFSQLTSGNWYKLSFSTNVAAIHRVDGEVDLYDLGATGLSTPTLVASKTGTTTDSIFSSDSSITVSFCGAHWGGAAYLDNFTSQGVKAGSASSVNNAENAPVHIYPNPATDHIVVAGNATGEASTYRVLNAQGQLVKTGKLSGTPTTINVADLPVGLYNLVVLNKTSRFIKK